MRNSNQTNCEIDKNGIYLAETICKYFNILSSSRLTWAWNSVDATKVSNEDGGKFADFLLFRWITSVTA